MLTRFKNESIIINTPAGRIEVVIMYTGRDGKVRLGITAPKAVTIHRAEIQLRIDKENKQKGVTNGASTNLPSETP